MLELEYEVRARARARVCVWRLTTMRVGIRDDE